MKKPSVYIVFTYFAFFLSGASGLMSEVSWNSMLVIIVGNTVAASSLIAMSFMFGLGLGSFFSGRVLRNKKRSIVPYVVLEMIIGLYVLLSPYLFNILSNKFFDVASPLLGTPQLFIVRLVFSFACLVFPAFLMGATFPAIILSLPKKDPDLQVLRAGYLYGLNTCGATLGCLLTGYFLLPYFGMKAALQYAGFVNIVAAILGMLIFYISKDQRALDERQKNLYKGVVGHLEASQPLSTFLNISIFFKGFFALAYQILMVRIVILLFGNAVQVFSLVLTAFLIGTGLSALIGTKLLKIVKKTEYLFSGAFILSGLLVILSPIMLAGLPYVPFSWALGAKGFQFMILGVVLLPVLLSGSLVPITIKLFQADGIFNSTYQSSKIYAINTAGAVFGAALTNYYLIPLLGTDGVLSFIAINSVSIGLLLFWMTSKSDKRIYLTLVCSFVCLFILVKLPGTINEIYVSAMTNQEDHDSEKKLFYEGKAVTVAVLDSYNNSRRLFLNGVEEVSTRYNHIQLFKTLGMLPMFMHEADGPSDVLMIGFGAGITASAAMDTGKVSRLDVIDINPDIEKINELFKEANNDIYHNPKFNFINEDGRNYLFLNRQKYNVIISDSTHPFAYDSWVLYTIEFYNEVKKHLNSGGVFVQWIPLNIPQDYLKVFLKTFVQVFPHSTFWNIPGSDQSFVIATEKPLSIDISRLQSQLNSMPLSTKLREYELSSAINILSFFALDTAAINDLIVSEKKISTDNKPHTFRSIYEKDIEGDQPASLNNLQVSVLPYVKNLTVENKLMISRRQSFSKLLHRFFVNNDLVAIQIAHEMFPQDMSVLYYMGYDPMIYSWDQELFSSSENAVTLQKVEQER